MCPSFDDSLQVLPPLDPDKLAALRASIEAEGVIEPIVMDQHERIIDGHHRSAICKELGKPCPFVVVKVRNDDEARNLAITLNTLRREIDAPLWAQLAAGYRENGLSLRDIALRLGVSKDSIANDLAQVSSPRHLPDRVTGRDGKSYPTTQGKPAALVVPGDSVIDDQGDEREVEHVEVIAGEVVLFDEDGEAIITHPDTEVEVRAPVSKPDLGGGVSHPARFSLGLLPVFEAAVPVARYPRVLDPFAGTGRIHELENETVGIELEPEWAKLHPDTLVGDARYLPFNDASFDAIVTSPTYGNRFADKHDAKDGSLRRSYTHDLGRKLTAGNSGGMQWGQGYRDLHMQAWEEAWRVLRPGGRFVLNIKDHDRNFTRQYVSAWHVSTLFGLGFELVWFDQLDAGGLRRGENAEERYPEQIFVLDTP